MPTRTLSAAGGNWNTAATWVELAVPVAGDAVVMLPAGASGPLTVNTGATVNCTSIDFTNYTNTLTVNGTLTAQSCTLVPGMTITTSAGTPVLRATTGSGTYTSNGVTWPYELFFNGTAITTTMGDDWTVGSLRLNTNNHTINSNTINCMGSLTEATSVAKSGTTSIILTGTGTWSNSSTGNLNLNLTINTAGTITLSSNVRYGTGTFTYTAGTIVNTGSTVIFTASTINASGMTFNNIIFGTGTTTLSSNLNIAGTLTCGGSVAAVANGNTINLGGNLVLSGGATLLGTSNLVFNSATSQTWVGGTSGCLGLSTEFNLTGTVVFSGNCIYGTGTLLYTSGTLDWSTGSLQIQVTCTLNLNSQTIPNVSIGTTNTTITMASGLIISQSFTATGATAASHSRFISSSPGTQRVLTLLRGATCDLGFINATDIDSSGGRAIYTRKGTLSNATNWKLLTEPKTLTA